MDLKDCLKKMDAAGRLAHVHTEVDAVHELSGVAAKLDGGKAVVFEHVKGYDYPVSTGMWWNRENVAAIFDRSVDALPALFAAAVGSLHQNPVAPVVVDDAPAQQVTMPEVDLGRIPVPTTGAQRRPCPIFPTASSSPRIRTPASETRRSTV